VCASVNGPRWLRALGAGIASLPALGCGCGLCGPMLGGVEDVDDDEESVLVDNEPLDNEK